MTTTCHERRGLFTAFLIAILLALLAIAMIAERTYHANVKTKRGAAFYACFDFYADRFCRDSKLLFDARNEHELPASKGRIGTGRDST